LLNVLVAREIKSVRVLSARGEVENQAGHPEDAIADYTRVLQDDPNNIPVLNNLAYLLADTQTDPDRALELAQRVKE
jgi:tetratricopeptide (TPR) repeat protein